MGKQTKQKTNSNEESLLNKIKQLEADNFLLSSPQGLTTVGPLPSTSGGNTASTNTTPTTGLTAAPVSTTTGTPPAFSPTTSYRNSASFNQSESIPVIMNAEAMAKAEAQQLEENKKADEYNATLPSRINGLLSQFPKNDDEYDSMGRPITRSYTPMAPLPVIPKEIEVPNMVVANHSKSYGESKSEGTSGRQPKPNPGEVYGMGVNGNNLEATFYEPGTYRRSSSRSHIMANADNALVAAKSVIENMFGTNSELSDIKPNKDVSFNYYVLQNGKMIPTSTPQNMGLPNETIPNAIMKLAKNIYIKDYGTDGLDIKNAQNGTGASGLLFNISALKSNSGGEYENKIYKSIGKALDILNLTSKSFSNGDKNNVLVDSFRKNPQFLQTVASGDRAAKDKFAKDSRSILEEVIYTMLLAQALGKDV